MKTLTIDVAPLSEALDEFVVSATRPGTAAPTEQRISFASPELLWKVLNPERWAMLRAMAGAGPLSLDEIAGRAALDPEAVQDDVRALLVAGVLESASSGRVLFPFEAIHVDFVLKAA